MLTPGRELNYKVPSIGILENCLVWEKKNPTKHQIHNSSETSFVRAEETVSRFHHICFF
jgi:hypothetical protein